MPSNARVFGPLEGWRAGLEEAGIDETAEGKTPDLAVGTPEKASLLVESGAPMVVVEGRGAARTLRKAGYSLQRWVPVGGMERPDMLLPLDQPAAARYALQHWMLPDARAKQLRNKGVAALVTRGAWPRPAPAIVVGSRRPAPPVLSTSAREALGITPSELFVSLGGSDDLARGVAHLFRAGVAAPDWVLKFSRVPGYSVPFDLDERGLALAAQLGGLVAEHAPRLVGRFRMNDLEASVETAARGRRMVNYLKAPGPRAEKLAAIERVAGWIVDVARETSGPPESLDDERRRLRDEVVPTWSDHGVSSSLVDDLPPIPSVMRRGDLGAWNIVADDDDFTAVDWETAHLGGFPLWDLLYFLTDALAHLDGASEDEARDEHARALFRGDGRSSPVLFEWVRRAVRTSSLPAEAVGPIATLLWMSVGLAHVRRGAAAQAVRAGARVQVPPAERIAPLWLTDPQLGPAWNAWRSG
jgi:hypothetical protein